MSKFFIYRPIFAWVLAIITCFAGIISVTQMPVEQFPKIAPPTVLVTATLPGASAETLEKTVTQVIEQSLTGIDNLRYFSSSSSSSGQAQVTITFEQGANPDIAQVQVQNKIQSALPSLPQEVKDQGILVTKANPSFLLVVALYSKTGQTSGIKLNDLMSSVVSEALSRISGVGDVNNFSSKHAMRIWLKPEKLYAYNISPLTIVSSIQAQNAEITAGQLGGLPSVKGQQINATIKANSKMKTKEEFENIILRADVNGAKVKLKDVAEVEIGSQSYLVNARYNKQPASALAVSLDSTANALVVSEKIKQKMEDLKKSMPSDVEIAYPYDTIPFVKISIKSVIQTLIEAFILVFLVMFLFLQNFRATLIPALAIPVVVLGTFAVLHIFGFSVNTLTMFAMVLSIGLLVDDAIVVVENVERIMHEEGLSPFDATVKSMGQIQGALVGIGIVLSAVFIPMAFFSGSAGAIYKQFSITIVSSMAISVLVALIFSPALCTSLLKVNEKTSILTHNRFFTFFNNIVERGQNFFISSSSYLLAKVIRFFLIYVVMIGGIIYLFIKMPTAFLPNEDQGSMYLMLMTPAGSTAERTLQSLEVAEDYFLKKEGENVKEMITVLGYSFAGVSQNSAFGFIRLKDWNERKRKDQSVGAITGRAMFALQGIKDAFVFSFFPPPIRELGNASGFDMQLIDKKSRGHEELIKARNQMLFMSSKVPYLTAVRPNGLEDVPQLKLDINYEKASSLGVSFSNISSTLRIAFGSAYIGDFIDEGKVKQVYMQGINSSRMLPTDISKWFVLNNKNEMVPLASFIEYSWVYGSPKLERFNGFSSVNIQGSASAGISSGIAMKIMEKLAEKLPEGFEVAWQGVSYEEKQAGSKSLMLYAVSIFIVFLALAALYESWSIPFSVILSIPFGFLGALVFSKITGLNNDVYFQIALLTTIGLSAKNAILIVEFAREMHEKGEDLIYSILHAVKQRFRPIMMTSMAFILGVVPLAISTGAGSNAQNAIGISVIGGMIFATFIAPIFVPLFYISILKLTKKK